MKPEMGDMLFLAGVWVGGLMVLMITYTFDSVMVIVALLRKWWVGRSC